MYPVCIRLFTCVSEIFIAPMISQLRKLKCIEVQLSDIFGDVWACAMMYRIQDKDERYEKEVTKLQLRAFVIGSTLISL